MKYLTYFLFIFIIFNTDMVEASTQKRSFPLGTQAVYISDSQHIRSQILKNIAPIVNQSIKDGYYPGAVILASHQGKIIYQGIFGNRRILPQPAPMRADTIFDVASLTKVIVTTTAIMQLAEQGKLEIDAPVVRYWPEFSLYGKESVTIRELMTHTSGLPADLPSRELTQLLSCCSKTEVEKIPTWHGKLSALQQIEKLKLQDIPGTKFLYSDINFIILGYLVEIMTHESLDHYAEKNIFNPLKMKNTYFTPAITLRDRIAPTEIINNKLRWGEVHDPTVYLMDGISGMAGLFSNAKDLGLFADCLLNHGRIPHTQPPRYLLAPLTVLKMTTKQNKLQIPESRGLGWDIDSSYSVRGIFLSNHSYGHTGWTGVSIWIDPDTKTWIIILTSRTHPTPNNENKLLEDRRLITNIIASSLS